MIEDIPMDEISIHVPAWGTTGGVDIEDDDSIFQSTFPRGERPATQALTKRFFVISIHVPAWGTTTLYFGSWFHTHISIHVPAWGTTVQMLYYENQHIFQSTFPRGERH